MVNILRINDTTMTPEELIEVIRVRRNESTLADGAEQKIKEVRELSTHPTKLITLSYRKSVTYIDGCRGI